MPGTPGLWRCDPGMSLKQDQALIPFAAHQAAGLLLTHSLPSLCADLAGTRTSLLAAEMG